jgi:hypothetical protein
MNSLKPKLLNLANNQIFSIAILSCIISAISNSNQNINNSGYVDPNLYIGYATNFNWLLDSSGFEYHATRILFIGFISALLEISIDNFGFFYKFFIISFFLAMLLRLGKILIIKKYLLYSSAIVIILSPLFQSALSWTMPNGFAAILSTAVLSFGLIRDISRTQTLLLGFFFTSSFLLNAFGSSIVVFLILVYQVFNYRKIRIYLKWCSKFFLSTLLSIFLYQIFWSLFLQRTGSIWEPHFRVIFDRTIIENWSSDVRIFEDGFLIFIFSALAFLIAVFLSQRGLDKVAHEVSIAGFITLVYCFLFFIAKLNWSFNAFWYYYIYIPIIALMLLVTINLLQKKKYFAEALLFLIIATFIIAKIAVYFKLISFVHFIFVELFNLFTTYYFAILVVLFIFFVTSLFVIQHLKMKSPSNILQFIPLILIVIFIFAGQTLMRPLLTSYNSPSEVSKKLLVDQIEYNKVLSKLNSTFGKVATWQEPDASGYRGSIISASAFHLLRIEGKEGPQKVLNRESWRLRKGTDINCLVLIISETWKPTIELKHFNDFKIFSEHVLPSNSTKLLVYCND